MRGLEQIIVMAMAFGVMYVAFLVGLGIASLVS